MPRLHKWLNLCWNIEFSSLSPFCRFVIIFQIWKSFVKWKRYLWKAKRLTFKHFRRSSCRAVRCAGLYWKLVFSQTTAVIIYLWEENYCKDTKNTVKYNENPRSSCCKVLLGTSHGLFFLCAVHCVCCSCLSSHTCDWASISLCVDIIIDSIWQMCWLDHLCGLHSRIVVADPQTATSLPYTQTPVFASRCQTNQQNRLKFKVVCCTLFAAPNLICLVIAKGSRQCNCLHFGCTKATILLFFPSTFHFCCYT